jgi:hypothetical protein
VSVPLLFLSFQSCNITERQGTCTDMHGHIGFASYIEGEGHTRLELLKMSCVCLAIETTSRSYCTVSGLVE